MAMMARVFRVVKSALGTLAKNPGQSVIVQIQTPEGATENRELFHAPGLVAAPAAGERAITLQLGDAPQSAVVIATQNYQITVQIGQGETLLYSTTADGKTLKAQVKLDASGNVTITGGNVTITGGQVTIEGSAAPTAKGPFCALPNCLFTGTPHIGDVVTGT